MSILEAIILGIVQGLTEFLPVSSSGHLVITERIMGIQSDSLALELVMHLGTLCAVIFAYRKKLLPLITHPFSKPVKLLIIATVPTVVIVFLFNSIFRAAFDGRYLVYCFLITAILLMIADRRPLKKRFAKKSDLGYLDAAIIGITQGFAAFPGISRSGSTISVSTLLGNDKQTSADFSFIMSIPIIIGSAAYELLTTNSVTGIGFSPLFAGFITSFVCGLFAIRLFLKILKKVGFDGFAIYLFCLSIFILLNDNFLFLF